ncbi:MAG: 2-oxoglutarate dehydrogenase complex dihydrolipoyllysine-residue succinyltransferase [Planctomycetota bacterium]
MNIEVPALGESITEAVISSWLVAEGEWVNDGDEIVELETDKVTMPLPSPGSGVLKHGAEEGDTVEVGATIGELDESAEKPAGAPAGAATSSNEPASQAAGPASPPPPAPPSAPTTTAEPPPPPAQPASTEPAHATPLASKLASELNVPLDALRGTGPGGRIREQDVLAASQSGGTPLAPTNGHAPAPSTNGHAARSVRTERMSQLRQRIAVRLVEAQHTAAMLTTFNECDMTNVMALRSKFKDRFVETHGVKLGFMSFFVKAVVAGLRAVPAVGAQLVDGEKGPELAYHEYADIAVAVGTEKGLVVPVLRNAERLAFHEIEAGILELAKKARDGKLTLDDMSGGTFTISNGGVYGSMLSTPILNPPQSGILGMHNIIKRPIEHPGKPGEIALRPMMYLALSYDHRIVDGEGAVTFLKTIKEHIEDPERLLLEV